MKNNLKTELNTIKIEIKPQSEWVASTRAFLMQQIEPQRQSQLVPAMIGDYSRVISQFLRQYLFEPAVVMMFVLVSFVITSLTINAAFYSLPGDRLYPVKIALEKTQLALVSGEDQKVELKIQFAATRVAEIDKIVQQTNVDPQQQQEQIAIAVNEFKSNVSAVNDHLTQLTKTIKQLDGKITDVQNENTVRMALAAGSKTEELAKSFNAKMGELAQAAKPEIKDIVAQAVQTVQETNLSAQQLVSDAKQIGNDAGGSQTGSVEGTSTDMIIPKTVTTTSTSATASTTSTTGGQGTPSNGSAGETTDTLVK